MTNGELILNTGMASGNPGAVLFINFTNATMSGGEDQTGNTGSSDRTARRKRYLAPSRGAPKNSVRESLVIRGASQARGEDRLVPQGGSMGSQVAFTRSHLVYTTREEFGTVHKWVGRVRGSEQVV